MKTIYDGIFGALLGAWFGAALPKVWLGDASIVPMLLLVLALASIATVFGLIEQISGFTGAGYRLASSVMLALIVIGTALLSSTLVLYFELATRNQGIFLWLTVTAWVALRVGAPRAFSVHSPAVTSQRGQP